MTSCSGHPRLLRSLSLIKLLFSTPSDIKFIRVTQDELRWGGNAFDSLQIHGSEKALIVPNRWSNRDQTSVGYTEWKVMK
jgi:hypothetical protein